MAGHSGGPDAFVRLSLRLDQLASRLEVRRATSMGRAELQEASMLLAQAFQDHPLFVAVYPDAARRRAACPPLFAAFLKDGLTHGIVEVAYDGRMVGVLIAYAPGAYPMSLARKVRRGRDFIRIAGADPAGLVRLTRIQNRLLRMHPSEPHYYCFLVGAAPGHLKGAGLVLAKRLAEQADREGVPVYLEAQERATADVYTRFGGCRVLREGLELYPGGPLTWTLWHQRAEPGAERP